MAAASAGGGSSLGVVGTAELFDPATNAWSTTGSMLTPRREHTATPLPSGQVLVVGGYAEAGMLYTP